MSKELGTLMTAASRLPVGERGLAIRVLQRLSGPAAGRFHARIKTATSDPFSERIYRSDNILRLWRSLEPLYPDDLGIKKFIEPGLQHLGPVEYSFDVIQYFQGLPQLEGGVTGEAFYTYLVTEEGLDLCLGLMDGMVIADKVLCSEMPKGGRHATFWLWRSTYEDDSGAVWVPCLRKTRSNGFRLDSKRLEDVILRDDDFALRFPNH